MNDVKLWHRLAAAPADEALASELAALAEQPFGVRAPFLGLAARFAGHADPALRAAAVRALAGTRGMVGVRAVVAGLDDADPAVRAAAVAALRETAADAPFRLTHALFHREADVRRAAVAPTMPAAVAPVGAYLRADPDTRHFAALCPWPRRPLPLLFELYAAKSVDADEMLKVFSEQKPDEIRRFLSVELGRGTSELGDYLSEASRSAAPARPRGYDAIELVCAALGEAPAREARALEVLGATVTGKRAAPLARRAFVALFDRGVRSGFTAPAVALCAALEPGCLAFPGFPVEHAAAAAEGLRRHRKFASRAAGKRVRKLLALPIARARLDLAAALAGLLSSHRLRAVADALGEAAIIDGLVAGDTGWVELCDLRPEGAALELDWLDRVAARDPGRHVALAAIALLRWGGDGKRADELIGRLSPAARQGVGMAIVRYAEADPNGVGDNRLAAASTALARALDDVAIHRLLTELLAGELSAVALAFVQELARSIAPARLASIAAALSEAVQSRLVAELCDGAKLSWDIELAIAQALTKSGAGDVRDWAVRRLRDARRVASGRPAKVDKPRKLKRSEINEIATCDESDLEAALAPAFEASALRLCAALARRPGPRWPHVAATAAVLACADPIEDAAIQLERFIGHDGGFADALDAMMVARWNDCDAIGVLAHAWLYRWERHTGALSAWIDAKAGGLIARLRDVEALPAPEAVRGMWRGLAQLVTFWRYRDRARIAPLGNSEVADYLCERIDSHVGYYAARMLVAIVESGKLAPELASIRNKLRERAADTDARTRELLARIVRLDGLPEPASLREREHVRESLLEEIRWSRDLDQLEELCRKNVRPVVEAAVLRLLDLGEPGADRLARLAADLAELVCPLPIVQSIPLWSVRAAVDHVRALAGDESVQPEVRFRIAMALVERGEADLVGAAIAAARAPAERAWFLRADWDALVAALGDERCALELVDSPHPHAYQYAVKLLIGIASPDDRVRAALVRFLETGAQRPSYLRRIAARALAKRWNDLTGLPILLVEAADPENGDPGWVLGILDGATRPTALRALVDMALIGGATACTEKRLIDLLQNHSVSTRTRLDAFAEILEHGLTRAARRIVALHLSTARDAAERVHEVARSFAWGIRRGRELTDRLFRVHMTNRERDFGYTYLNERRVFVSPLPILRGERYGRDIVEGLILHEFGHHMFHGGEDNGAVWKRAERRGLHHLLNLVADEHLERNLRAIDAAYGDRIKRLAAYAFRHAAQEIFVVDLLDSLRGSAAPALIATPLEVAFHEEAVRINRGAVLAELDAGGHPLARFTRALRLGLGNRTGDPLVDQALEMFGKEFRTLDMEGLYEITRKLADMFGGATAVAEVFGGSEGMTWGDRDDDVFGVDNDDVQREVDRILDPRQVRRDGPDRGAPGRLAINVGPDEEFEKIERVDRLRPDRDKHRDLAAGVKRHAMRLRAFLEDLGLRWLPVGARLQGRSVDRTRIRGLVLKGDPRILVARQRVLDNDLFIGVAVDCSGSMQAADNLGRAQRFGVLLAEATRGLPSVDVRFFGFTDTILYDAGDALDCAVTSLQASGGNNDAAALYHVANVAVRSRRRAKVLVMISDGLPTECSVAALKGLVVDLTRRRGLHCAQVAVRPLEEVCFPNYVVVNDAELDVAVARFGRIVGDLARRSLQR